MRIILLAVILLSIYSSGYTQAWKKIYKVGAGYEDPYDMAVDNLGNVIVAGNIYISASNSADLAIVKYSPGGAQLWDVNYGTAANQNENANAITTDSEGNVYVTGVLSPSDGGKMITAKFNSSGAMQWVADYNNGPQLEEGIAVGVDVNGNVYSVCISRSDYTVRLIKYNPAGEQQWNAKIDSAGGGIVMAVFNNDGSTYVKYDRSKTYIAKYSNMGAREWETPYIVQGLISSFKKDNVENLYLGGYDSFSGNTSACIVKFNSQGVFQWKTILDSNTRFSQIAVDNAGNITGVGYKKINNSSEVLVSKCSPGGSTLWTSLYNHPGTDNEMGDIISVDNIGNSYFVAHYYAGPQDGNVVMVKCSASGVIQWNMSYGGSSGDYDMPRKIIARSDYEFYVSIASANTGFSPDFVTFKFGTTTAVHQIGNLIPPKFSLYQNYPNPFNPETNIKFDLPEASNVKITIYNSLGKQMQVLADEHKPAGSYEVKFNSQGYAGGVYFYRVETEEFTQTKKMMLLK